MGGGLSNNYLNKHIQALEKFYEFLNHKGVQNLPPVTLRQLKLDKDEITVLTIEEVQQLYKATEKESDNPKQQAFNARDRAMLTVFYGCGLRRNEGVNLHVDDINFDSRIIHVKKGKNYQERLVPFSRTGLQYLQEWVYDYRPNLLKSKHDSDLFISYRGTPMRGNALYKRIKLLQCETFNPELQKKEIGLHTLRHSIATHLLQNGMELQKIQRFLGHKSLESTQIYTHLIEKENADI
jgi:integrase/recombinase XerD